MALEQTAVLLREQLWKQSVPNKHLALGCCSALGAGNTVSSVVQSGLHTVSLTLGAWPSQGVHVLGAWPAQDVCVPRAWPAQAIPFPGRGPAPPQEEGLWSLQPEAPRVLLPVGSVSDLESISWSFSKDCGQRNDKR